MSFLKVTKINGKILFPDETFFVQTLTVDTQNAISTNALNFFRQSSEKTGSKSKNDQEEHNFFPKSCFSSNCPPGRSAFSFVKLSFILLAKKDIFWQIKCEIDEKKVYVSKKIIETLICRIKLQF